LAKNRLKLEIEKPGSKPGPAIINPGYANGGGMACSGLHGLQNYRSPSVPAKIYAMEL